MANLAFAGRRPSSILLLVATLITYCHFCYSDFNRNYNVSKLCSRERHTPPLYKKIDGAVISSDMTDVDLDCIMTFQTDTILQRFMLRFEELALDCNDHLFIFDGAHAFNPKANLSCRSTRAELGTVFTHSNYLTLKYVTDKHSKRGDGFKLVITAFKDTPVGCSQLKCLNTFCISKDLACDTVNHCGDNSDETGHADCYTASESEATVVFGVDFNIFIGIVLSIFVVCLVCVVNLVVCLCRGNQLQQAHRIALHGQSTTTLAHPASFNETAVMLSPATGRYATLPLEKMHREKPPPPYPGPGQILGNAYSPASGVMNHVNHNSTSNNHLTGHHVIVTDSGTNGIIPQVLYYTTK